MAIRYEDRTKELIGKTDRIFDDLIKESTEDIAEEYRNKAPVITGKLKRGITSDVDGSEGTVGNTVDYSVFVEIGTVKSKGNNVLFNAIRKFEFLLPQRLKDKLGRLR